MECWRDRRSFLESSRSFLLEHGSSDIPGPECRSADLGELPSQDLEEETGVSSLVNIRAFSMCFEYNNLWIKTASSEFKAILPTRFWLSFFELISTGRIPWHIGLNMEGINWQHLERGLNSSHSYLQLDSYLPCPCHDFPQQTAPLKLIKSAPHTNSQVVTLPGSPRTRIQTHSALQGYPS